MKTVYFIRHSQLQFPYTNYSQLKFREISDLATGKLDPKIHSRSKKYFLNKNYFILNKLKKIDLIFTAPSQRAIETAKLFKKLSKNEKLKIRSTGLLNEIYFNPMRLTTEKKYRKFGMKEIRKSLFNALIEDKNSESLAKILTRISNLKKIFKNINEKHILCITHSFFMRVVHLYFLSHLTKVQQFTLDRLETAFDYPPLEGFKVKLQIP